jgi:hypothetical protein
MTGTASQSRPLCAPPERTNASVDSIANKMKFFISKRSYVCRVRRHWIILDVHSDQYYCIPAQQFDLLGSYIHGWPSVAFEVPPATDRYLETTKEILAQLVTKGVLTERLTSERELSLSPLGGPTSSLKTDDVPAAHGSRALLVATFWIACATADLRLRKQTFESIVQCVEARRSERSAQRPPDDPQILRYLVAAFNGLRLWYPRAYLCLFDSLALLEFLAWHDIYPRWTFGVTADPFQAHCWLQDGPIVLNDVLSRVCGYTPIMSV